MKKVMPGGGFTLIELLVVVLIIAILAAVALPQYQKAVEKSRAMQAVAMVKAIADANEAYYLYNGTYTNYLTDLDIHIPGTDYTFETTRRKKVGPFDFATACDAIRKPTSGIACSVRWRMGKVGVRPALYYFIRFPKDAHIYCTGSYLGICAHVSGGKTATKNGTLYYIAY